MTPSPAASAPPAKLMCLALLIDARQERILLGHKLRGFGTGRIVGLGGHIEPGESAAQAAVREVAEESSLVVAEADLDLRAQLTFVFAATEQPDLHVSVFVATKWSGTARPCEEIAPQWFSLDEIPWRQMWDDDRIWLPNVLRGERLEARMDYDLTGERVVAVQLQPMS